MYRTQIGLLIAVALVISFLAGWSLYPLLTETGEFPEPQALMMEDSVIVTIDNGDGTLEELPEVPYVPGDSVLSVLEVLQEAELITLSLAEFGPELAAVDVALSNLAEREDEAGWHFWVNDTYGTLSPEAYVIEPGDHIHLVFTPEQTTQD